jgi:nucleoside-diphosphate-sugar epimerase
MRELESLSGRRVLVTGASGFLGTHLCRRLRQTGAEVYGVSRTQPADEIFDAQWLRGDMADLTTVAEIFRETRPEVVYHLSGHGVGAPDLDHVLPTFRNDLTTTVNILSVAARSGISRLVMAASLEEPQPDAADPIPSSPYAAAKWASGAYARMFHRLYGTPVVMIRPMMTYGPGQRAHKLIPYVTLALLQGQAPTLSSGTRGVDWIYVEDVIDGMLAAAVKPGVEGCTIDLGSGVLVPIRDVVLQLAAIIGAKPAPHFGALPDRPMEKVRVADMTEAREKLGWQPRTSLRTGLERTVEWYRKELAQSVVGSTRAERVQ